MVFEINPSKREEAVQHLEHGSAVLLSSEQLREFVYQGDSRPPCVPPKMNDQSGLKPYLVRAVSANSANRSIAIHWCHRDLLSFRGSLGGGKPQKDPIIVFLNAKPRRVIPSFMVAN
jgi:hypothetical protein